MNSHSPKLFSLLSVLFLGLALQVASARDFPEVTDLDTALKNAVTEKKLVFIKYGRPTCGNCNALQELIETKALRLPESKYIFANINCDDAAQSKAFRSRYKVTGTTLPFVVIADSEGNMLASRTGYGTEAEFEELLKEAGKTLKKNEKAATPTTAATP